MEQVLKHYNAATTGLNTDQVVQTTAAVEVQQPLSSLDDDILNADTIETEQDKAHRERMEKINSCIVAAETVYPEEDNLLEIDGIGAYARQDLVAIKAKQKSGKSTMIAILIAAMLTGQWGKIKRLAKQQPRIIYVDTEMKERDTNLLNRKILTMGNLPIQSINDVKFVNLRKYNVDECCTMVTDIIRLFKPDIIFIDGIVDLIGDFNDIERCQKLIRSHLALAEEYNCCIVHVLHTNKLAEDHNMRGHLGTILSQKASYVFECKKDKTMNIVKVECDDYRHAPIPDWSFGFGNEGIPFPADDIIAQYESSQKESKEQRRAEKQQEERDRRTNILRKILVDAGPSGMTRKDLKMELSTYLGLGATSINDLLKNHIDNGFISPSGFNGAIVLSDKEAYLDND